MKWLKRNSNLLLILMLLLCFLPSIWALFPAGFFLSDDGEWMVIRFSAFYQAFRDGEFPVRWLGRLNQEYGYPVANFLYPGFMYLGLPIRALGVGFVDTIKLIMGISMIASGIFTYFWLQKLFHHKAAFIGALFYLYTPYHLFDLYKRGSVGELLALAIAPFIFWQVERKSFLWTALGIGYLILSHNTLAIIFLPIIIMYMFIRKTYKSIYQIGSLIVGLGISAFFWIPALFDLQYTKFFSTQVANWRDNFAPFHLVGMASLIVVVLAIGILLRKHIKEPLFLLFLFCTSFGISMSLSMTSIIWEFLPVSFVQFPFRFLSITIVGSAFLSAYLLQQFQKNKIMVVFLLLALFLSAVPFLKPVAFFDKGEGFYATNMDTTTVQNEYMPRWVEASAIERPKQKVEQKGKAEDIVADNNYTRFVIDMHQEGVVRINTLYFPGWKAFVDTQESAILYGNAMGVIDVLVPAGKHTVAIAFSETPIRLASDTVSVASLVILGIAAFYRRRKN